ncbi:MAG: hypothetical protein K9N38_02050 [Candidatus Marinimicrobia bacterium]|nr:hypothetical protein [Candidatus Neomarinimicrobiota bacterium]MCF7850335.1 hypothetical protein [Candidatus Neomarinimicrobiota bacterium]
MRKRLTLIIVLIGLVNGQSSWDVLTLPTDARDAALGINLNPLVRPAELAGDTEPEMTLSGWSWIEDIQGAHLGVELQQAFLGVTAVNFGEFEYRDDVPSLEPLSTFGYSIFSFGGAYALEWDQLRLGLATELLYERTVNASSVGLSMNLSGAYPISDQLQVGAGMRHLGLVSALDSEATDLPTEAWLAGKVYINELDLYTELSSGSFPLSLGMSYEFADIFEAIGGLQLESTEPSLRVHPSIGFTVNLANFRLGYSNYQMSHKLGSRHFLSLYWNY